MPYETGTQPTEHEMNTSRLEKLRKLADTTMYLGERIAALAAIERITHKSAQSSQILDDQLWSCVYMPMFGVDLRVGVDWTAHPFT